MWQVPESEAMLRRDANEPACSDVTLVARRRPTREDGECGLQLRIAACGFVLGGRGHDHVWRHANAIEPPLVRSEDGLPRGQQQCPARSQVDAVRRKRPPCAPQPASPARGPVADR